MYDLRVSLPLGYLFSEVQAIDFQNFLKQKYNIVATIVPRSTLNVWNLYIPNCERNKNLYQFFIEAIKVLQLVNAEKL